MSFCTRLQIGPPSAEKNDVMSIFKMADLILGIMSSLKSSITTYKLLSFPENRVFAYGINIQDGRSPPSWILEVQ